MTDEEQRILANAAPGGAYDEVFTWAYATYNTKGPELAGRIAEVCSGLLGREVTGEDIQGLTAESVLWNGIWEASRVWTQNNI